MGSKSNHLTKGILLVIAGAASYGMLAPIVKTTYGLGFTTAEVTIVQYIVGIVFLLPMVLLSKNKIKLQPQERTKLLLAGVSFGLTSVLYYLSMQYIEASIAVVLLMQSVWISVVIEAIKLRKIPSAKKIIGVLIVLGGTILATNVLNSSSERIDFRGILFGFLAAISFALVLYSTNTVAVHLPPAKRSLYMLYGGSIAVLGFAFLTQIGPYYFNWQWLGDGLIKSQPLNLSLIWTWGIPIGLFGTVIPPLMFNKGFPLTGIGLGSILSSFELPVSIAGSFLMLHEVIVGSQWIGVLLILVAIILLNINFKTKTKNDMIAPDKSLSEV